MDLNNTVIKVLNKEHGAKVIEFYKKNGYYTEPYYGINIGYYYGIYNNEFAWYTDFDMKRFDFKIIELPKENVYPKVMMVSNCPITKGNNGKKRVVFMEKLGKYLAWSNAETIEDAEKQVETRTWKYAADVPKENPQKPKCSNVLRSLNLTSQKCKNKLMRFKRKLKNYNCCF